MRRLAGVLAVLLPAPSAAQGWIEPLPRPVPGVVRAEKVRTSVTVRVTGRVARVEVEEWFRNPGGGLAEGDYLYPLPGEASFTDYALFLGEQELRGEVMDAAQARSIYEEIVRRHQDPALIELAGHGLIRARVFPIEPGATRKVTLRYTQVLGRAGDALHFRYAAGRATAQGLRPPRVEIPGGRAAAAVPVTFTVTVDSAGQFGAPHSPTHPLSVARQAGRLIVRPQGELAGDFDVFLPYVRPVVGISLAAHRSAGEDGYFMLALSPAAVAASSTPRDVAAVVDVSGSMSGEKMEQARQALHRLLETLGERDRFRLISFSGRVDAHDAGWTEVTGASLAAARGWVDRLAASGGTNIDGALAEAFRAAPAAGRLPIVIFITDGVPTVGETDPDRIAAQVEASRGEARIFAFGVGHDLNAYLLERIAAAGRGAVAYVQPGEDVEAPIARLAAKVTHPVLVDLRIESAPGQLLDLQPARLPDLFAGDELILFGRYRGAGTVRGELVVSGVREGRRERFGAVVELPARAGASGYLPGLWASRKLGELMRTIRLEGETPARIEEVRALALRYGLLSEYTSYLVQEPGMVATHARPAPMMLDASAQAGEAAVRSAKAAGERRAAVTVAEVTAAEAAMAELTPAGTAQERLVAGRRFRLADGTWVDAGHTAAARVVEVEAFSDACFALVARLPELRAAWGALERVVVAGGDISIRIAAGGARRLSPAELDDVVTRFRAGAQRRR
jgi:Ca-activated chloride channel homolog